MCDEPTNQVTDRQWDGQGLLHMLEENKEQFRMELFSRLDKEMARFSSNPTVKDIETFDH